MSDAPTIVSRRTVLAGSGALILSFSSSGELLAQDPPSPQAPPPGPSAPPALPGSLKQTPFLDSWIRVDADGSITVFTGKAELGQGIKTALLQVAAEQLDADFGKLSLVTADTGRTANEGYTAGSHSMQDSGTAIMNAAAQVRQILIAEAAARSGLPNDQMKTENATVIAPNGNRYAYGDLVKDQMLHVQASPQSVLKDPSQYKIMNRRIPRVDIPAKLTGGAAYVQDMRPDGMVHGRVVRPPSYDARLIDVDTSAVQKMPGVLKVVRDGSFLAVIAGGEFEAIEAMRALAAVSRWQETAKLPDMAALPGFLTGLPPQDITVLDRSGPGAAGAKTLSATYSRPYLSHGSIGPSCAVGQLRERCAHGLDAYAGCLPRSRCDCRNAAHAEGKGALHPYRRVRLLWPQRCGRRRRRRRATGAGDARPAGARAMDARTGTRFRALRPGDGGKGQRHLGR